MSDSILRKPTDKEIKEYLIAISKDITEINKVLREDIENIDSGGNIIVCVYHLIRLGFMLDKMTDRKFLEVSEYFSKHAAKVL